MHLRQRIRLAVARYGSLAVLATGLGCAYYNGVYNARRADRAAERALLDGDDSAAAQNFAIAAAAAETVLARYPRSRWATEASYLSGRGLAFTGSCGAALTRLEAYRGHAPGKPERERAALASGRCLTTSGRYAEALTALAPLLESREREIAVPAARISAQAFLALGDDANAARVLVAVDAAGAEWLLARDALGVGRTPRAESLLARRVAVGDVRDEMPDVLRKLWAAGDSAAALRLAVGVAGSRAPTAQKARVRVAIGELLASSGRDADAREVLLSVPRLSSDSNLVARARELLAQLSLSQAATPSEVAELLKRSRPAPEIRRLDDALLLVRILDRLDGENGAGRFLAAEVARDSLHAIRLSRSLFVGLPAASPLAPKAWLAAGALAGDSAATYVAVARSRWPSSPYVLAVDGRDSPDTLAIVAPESMLRDAWARAIVVYGDSLATHRAAAVRESPPTTP